jgi:hypothetical protein
MLMAVGKITRSVTPLIFQAKLFLFHTQLENQGEFPCDKGNDPRMLLLHAVYLCLELVGVAAQRRTGAPLGCSKGLFYSFTDLCRSK